MKSKAQSNCKDLESSNDPSTPKPPTTQKLKDNTSPLKKKPKVEEYKEQSSHLTNNPHKKIDPEKPDQKDTKEKKQEDEGWDDEEALSNQIQQIQEKFDFGYDQHMSLFQLFFEMHNLWPQRKHHMVVKAMKLNSLYFGERMVGLVPVPAIDYQKNRLLRIFNEILKKIKHPRDS